MKFSSLVPFRQEVFSQEQLSHVFHEPLRNVQTQLSRWYRRRQLLRLKKNRYAFPDQQLNSYLLAQELVSPSYISAEVVLSRAGIIPENVFMTTSITSKKTQRYATPFGTFDYRHLPPHLFFGVEKRSDGAWVATPEKALLDYLYLDSKWFKPDFKCWQGERFDELDLLDWGKMKEWAPKYGMKKLIRLVDSVDQYRQSEAYQDHR